MDTWLTKAEAASYLRVSPQTIDRYVRNGRLSKGKLAGTQSVRFRKSDLDNLVEPDDSGPLPAIEVPAQEDVSTPRG